MTNNLGWYVSGMDWITPVTTRLKMYSHWSLEVGESSHELMIFCKGFTRWFVKWQLKMCWRVSISLQKLQVLACCFPIRCSRSLVGSRLLHHKNSQLFWSGVRPWVLLKSHAFTQVILLEFFPYLCRWGQEYQRGDQLRMEESCASYVTLARVASVREDINRKWRF